jgi:hypothetical protein
MGMCGKRHAPAALYPRKWTPRYPLDKRLGGPQSWSGTEARGNILCLCRVSNAGRQVCSQTQYWLAYTSSSYMGCTTCYLVRTILTYLRMQYTACMCMSGNILSYTLLLWLSRSHVDYYNISISNTIRKLRLQILTQHISFTGIYCGTEFLY